MVDAASRRFAVLPRPRLDPACCDLIFSRSIAPQDMVFFGTLIKAGQDVWVSKDKVEVDGACKTLIGVLTTDSSGRDKIKICNCESECFAEGTLFADRHTGLDRFVGRLGFGVVSVCCLSDDTCREDLTCPECEAEGGRCKPDADSCKDVVGACCGPSGDCTELTRSVCERFGGEFLGPCTDCADAPGGCCLPGGGCEHMSRQECDDLGGTFQGPCKTCDTAPGACCLSKGGCQVLTKEECEAAGGSFRGRCTNCSPFPAPCCFPDNSCRDDITWDQCLAMGGERVTPPCGSCADVIGGCCRGNLCLGRLPSDECADLGGEFVGVCTTCDDAPASCCFPDGTCGTYPDQECRDRGGMPGAACAQCDVRHGACCFPNGDCLPNRSRETCDAAQGIFLGPCSLCGSGVCDLGGAGRSRHEELQKQRDKVRKKRRPSQAKLTLKALYKYAKAKFGPKVDSVTRATRMGTCEVCPKAVEWQGELYCDSCGCGDRDDARLRIKTKMLRATCPLGKWPRGTDGIINEEDA